MTIATSPVSIQIQTLSQTPSGQPLSLAVIVRSNASSPIDSVGVAAQYPSGFVLNTSDPSPTGSNFFTLGTLNPGDQKTIKINGSLTGQNADQRVFNFVVGSSKSDGTTTIGSPYAKSSATVVITHPFLNVGLSLNREAVDTIITKPGDRVGGMLTWQNMLAGQLTNASIHVGFSGNALAPASISGGTGFFRSDDTSVVFDSTTNSGLAALSSGDSGSGNFSFGIKPVASLIGVKNPTVVLSVSITGQQPNQGTTPQVVRSTLTRTVKIGTQVSLAPVVSKVSGPVPPVAGTETIYQVALNAKNTVNSVGAARVTFSLPSYVRFTGQNDASISFNPDSRMVTWTIGDIASGATASARFQVAITPSTSQHDTEPILVTEETFSGIDRFTGQQISALAPSLTTELQGSAVSGTVK